MEALTPSAVVKTKNAVIFDLFHTLTSIESTWGNGLPTTHEMLGVSKEAWDIQLQQKSRDRLIGKLNDAFKIISGMAWAIDPCVSNELIKKAIDSRIRRFSAALICIPEETISVLNKIKSMSKKIGLISNADVMEAEAWNQSPIAHLFDSVVLSCYVGCAKPEKEIYRISMRQLEVAPKESVFVGDGGSNELEGAKSLGITTILITGIIRKLWPEKIEERKRHADFIIEHLSELIQG